MENVWKRRRQVSKNAPSTPIIMSRSHLKYHLNKYKYARMYYTILYKKIKRITKNHPPHLPIKNYKFKSPLKAPIYIYQEKKHTISVCLCLSLSLTVSLSLSLSKIRWHHNCIEQFLQSISIPPLNELLFNTLLMFLN